MSDSRNPGRPIHLWIVGIVALLWNLMGAYDYLMTQTRNEAYMAKFTPEQLEYYYNFPAWADGTWAIAVWGALLGSILLLLTRRLAVWVYLVSLAAMVLTTVYSYGFSDGMQVMEGAGHFVFTAVIFVISVALYLYAKAMAGRGVLR